MDLCGFAVVDDGVDDHSNEQRLSVMSETSLIFPPTRGFSTRWIDKEVEW